MQVDANFLSALGAISAIPIAIFAAYVAKQADSRAKVTSQTGIYLSLRSRFLEVHSKLPPQYSDPDWEPRDASERNTVTRYWHHAFDEWFVTTQLDPHLLRRQLWAGFFLPAVLSGLRHNGLRTHLLELVSKRREHDALWRDFASEIEMHWRISHPTGQGKCEGLRCSHTARA